MKISPKDVANVIEAQLWQWCKNKDTGRIVFEINLNQGGIVDVKKNITSCVNFNKQRLG